MNWPVIPSIVLCILSVTTLTFAAKSPAEKSAQSILDYLKEHDNNFILGSQKDVVLTLGITGSGTTTLTSLITDAELESVAIDSDYRIVDKNVRISDSIGFQTVISNVIIDEQNCVVIYDFPGFCAKRDVKNDLMATFAIRKVLNFAESVKFLFTVSYESFQVAIDDRRNFLELVRYATELIKDIEKYRDAISLVVTKVPNDYVEKDRQQQLEDDSAKIESIANFLRQTKTYLKNKTSEARTDEERQTVEQKIFFVDILLEKNEKGYTRIGIMRMPDKIGLISEIPLVQSEKVNILNIINENLRYIRIEDNDFGYNILNTSKVYINDVVKVLKRKLIADFAIMSADIKRFIVQKEKYSSYSLNESVKATTMIKQQLSEIISMEPKRFTKQLTDAVDVLGISLSTRTLKKFFKYIDFLDFAQLFSTNRLTIPIEIFDHIANHRAYLVNSISWYSFLIDIRDKLSKYSVQKRSKDYDGSGIMNVVIGDETTEKLVWGLGIQSTLESIDPQIYKSVQYLHVNMFKVKLLQGIWEQSMQPISKNCSADGKTFVAKGYNVLISDVLNSDCWPNATHIEIFAMNKVFFDADIKKPSIYLSIISPVWEIILDDGVKSRQIELSGANGMDYSSPAQEGISVPESNQTQEHLKYSGRGENGMPGSTGGPGGQFFGIGWFINNNRLEIYVNGGRGGNGQDGGKGTY